MQSSYAGLRCVPHLKSLSLTIYASAAAREEGDPLHYMLEVRDVGYNMRCLDRHGIQT
jgi:hypothetical protein